MDIQDVRTRRISWAAVALGVSIVSLGIFIALAALYMASISDILWLLLILPSVFLILLGGAVFMNRYDVGHVPRPHEPVIYQSNMDRVQDYAHHNKAWENVSRWNRKYGRGRPRSGGPMVKDHESETPSEQKRKT
jgi:hypothetical protein